jgi:hypothetical protein
MLCYEPPLSVSYLDTRQQIPEEELARKKERSRRKAAAETTPSQSSAEIHRPSEEQASTMYAMHRPFIFSMLFCKKLSYCELRTSIFFSAI